MWILLLYVSVGAGFVQSSTGGPAIIQDIPSHSACINLAGQIKLDLGSKLDFYRCYQIKE